MTFLAIVFESRETRETITCTGGQITIGRQQRRHFVTVPGTLETLGTETETLGTETETKLRQN